MRIEATFPMPNDGAQARAMQLAAARTAAQVRRDREAMRALSPGDAVTLSELADLYAGASYALLALARAMDSAGVSAATVLSGIAVTVAEHANQVEETS